MRLGLPKASKIGLSVSFSKPFHKRNGGGVTRSQTDSYNSGGESWWSIRAKVAERDGHKCRDCGTPENPKDKVYHECHHLKELSKGGQTVMSNLVLLCTKCHSLKHRHLR